MFSPLQNIGDAVSFEYWTTTGCGLLVFALFFVLDGVVTLEFIPPTVLEVEESFDLLLEDSFDSISSSVR